jgi:alkaline phosphatase
MATYFKINKRPTVVACVALMWLAGSLFAHESDKISFYHGSHDKREIKNIIVLVPDGCNQILQTLTRWYKGSDLTVDKMTSGMARTWSANSVITGSAAASSAFGTGFKTEEPFISVGPSGIGMLSTYTPPFPFDYLSYRPLATVLEGAKCTGKATGLIATLSISNATPAGQSAHVHDRNNELEIIEQQVYQNIDVVFGGGKNKLAATRTDGENFIDTLISRGYTWVETRDQMLSVASGKVWGLFAKEAMQPDIDRKEFGLTEPSLAEMTKKAIDLLTPSRKGFFLFVEASQTDYGDHNDDPIYAISDFLAFDEAVRVAVEFAEADGHTAVLTFPDHNCGGMTIGSYYSDLRVAYDKMPVEYLLNPLKGMLLTSVGVANKIANQKDPDQIKSAVQAWWNIALADSDVTQILAWPYSRTFSYKLAAVVSKNYTGIGWTTHGHDGGDVPIWTYNCDIGGNIENIQIAEKIFDMLDIDSKALNENLFINVNDVFPGAWTLDMTDARNPVLVITINNIFFRLPTSKDELYYSKDQSTIKKYLGSLVVYAPKTNRVYIPQNAVREIQRVAYGK